MLISRLYQKLYQYPVTAIVLAGIATRLFCVALYQHVTIFPDSEGYISLAQYISRFSFTGYDGLRNPGYPLLLSLAGNSLAITAALQMAIGLATAVFLYKTLLALKFKTSVSLLITLLLNSLLHVIFYETAILTESLTLFFTTMIFYLLFSGFLDDANRTKILLMGVLLGYLVLIKPFYIFLPFILFGLYVVKNFSIRKFINIRLTIFILPLLAYLGWSYVNQMNTGYFTSTSLHGIYLSQNCVYFAENVPEKYKQISDIYVKHRDIAIAENKDVAMSIWFAYDEIREKTRMTLPELSNELANFSKDAIKQNPGQYIKQVVTRSWWDFWKVDMYWNYEDFKVPYANKALLAVWLLQHYILLAVKIIFVLLLPYYVYRFFMLRKPDPDVVMAAIIFTTSILQALATYGTNSRFSYPFEFFIVISVLITAGRFFKKFKLQLY